MFSHYDLFIQTNLTERTFNGYASIEMNVVSSNAQHVTLHAHPDLALHSLIISNGVESHTIPSSSISRDEVRERFSFPIPNALKSREGDKLTLQIAWKANLSSLATGYYFDTYIDKHTGKEDIYSVTQFEPTSARAAFPCWDEVSPKATFKVSMLSDPDTINLSNMDVLDGCILGDCSLDEFDWDATQAIGARSSIQKLTHFRKTPLMSVYIVAFANGRFRYKEGSYNSPLTEKTIPLRVYGTSDVAEDVDCSLQVTKESMSSLETLFDIAYPLPKMDSLISAKAPGAMENWGLIVGGPQSLACPSNSGLAAYQAMFLMQTFATLTGEFIVPGILHPDWKTDDSFLTSHVFVALDLDGQRYSHPIEIEISDGDDIGNFDAISYSKGASVLRMLSMLIGRDTFLQGVSRYLKRHSYDNANTEDLWASITETSGIDVAAVAESWTQKIGFPILTTQRSGDSLIIRQDRFLSTGDISDEENETIWSIPLGLITIQANGTTRVHPQTMMQSREIVIALDSSAIYHLNSGFAGFFRVAYSPKDLGVLSVEACKQDICETSFVGWTAVVQALGSVRSVWWEKPDRVQKALDGMIKNAFGVVIERLGFTFSDTETLDISKLRTLAYATAGRAGYLPVVRHAKQAFTQYFDGNHSSIHPDLRKAAFGITMYHGGKEEFTALAALYHKLAPSA
ncbi:hypothetical protein HWV62_29887 [Athelia sp. TMB]|nr:hypothetical protein HWV62_29887 [Athelia sp. TMB]